MQPYSLSSGPAGSYQATLIHSNAHGGQPTIVSPASTNPNLLNVANNVPRPTNSASPAPLTSAQPLASSFPTDLRFSQNVGPLGYSQSPFKLSNVANNPRVLMNSAIGSSTVAQLPSYRSNDLPGRVSAMQASVIPPVPSAGMPNLFNSYDISTPMTFQTFGNADLVRTALNS